MDAVMIPDGSCAPACSRGVEQADPDAVGARIAAKIATQFSPPMAVADVFLTENCNHRCNYCFVKGKNDLHRMSEDVARDSVEFLIRSSRELRWFQMVLFGGEPLLEFDLLQFIVAYARKRGQETGKQAQFSITTNGTLMTPEIAGYFQQHGITYLLSIDGSKETHDANRKMVSGESSFDTVMSRLPMMKSMQPWQGARVTLHPDTVERLREDVELLYQRGINQFIIGPATGVDWPGDALREYERQMILVTDFHVERQKVKDPFRMTLYEKDLEIDNVRDQWGCGAGRGRVCISVKGDLYGCAKILGVYGPQDTHKLGDIWRGVTNLRARRDLLNTHPNTRPQCAKCRYADECSGGCPAVNWEATGDIFKPAPLECRITPIVSRIRKHYARHAQSSARAGRRHAGPPQSLAAA